MSRVAAIARTALVPVLADSTLRAEQVTQLVLGETAAITAMTGSWRRIVTHADGYTGWVHAGYVVETDTDTADAWRRDALGWSEGATLRIGPSRRRAPLRARLARIGAEEVRLPQGEIARVVEGRVPSLEVVVREARMVPAAVWAAERFSGAPYLWGGVTPTGVDCSGLVQTTFAARGVALPRDAADQAKCGAAVAPDAIAPDDLLFFRSADGDHITHVAIAGPDDTLVHSAVARGGVSVDARAGAEGQARWPLLAMVRRLSPHPRAIASRP